MSARSFENAFTRVRGLVATFRSNEKYYRSASFSEADARKDFIDKFWIAVGWDVNHERQTNPYEQEVKVERSLSGSERRRRADYAFLAPNFRDVLFYVEAKKPSAELENKDSYFQTIRYGWNSRTPLAVLTDFEEFHVLDCRYRPDLDSVLRRAVRKYHYSDYGEPEKFREIYHLFSREDAFNHSLERFAETLPKPSGKPRQGSLFAVHGYQTVDQSFLQKLDDYREDLARSFKRNNSALDSAELTEVTQRALDRLVFMRFLEDKLIEIEPLVETFGRGGSAWHDFIVTSQRLDRIYNGIIFKSHDLLDSPYFQPEEQVFSAICDSLSGSGSPYDFNAIPIHILGSIYERFLGKTIVVANNEATVEEKLEVRKAGGVFYTPEYIVRYIVENTVGQLIKGKTPLEIRQMRFADVACGSGSFLLGVFDLLLRYHTAYYNSNKRARSEGTRAGCRKHDGTLHLSLLQRREILLNNIYGVDIDPQAVEVAQLSLYLKLLEDETTASAHDYQLELRDALLPSLARNIICGNSLVGSDILDGELFNINEELNMGAMDFEDAFPKVMSEGGFDAIVGNPPYVRTERLDKRQLSYFKRKYSAEGQVDLYLLFIEKALRILKAGGRFGYITPKFFLFNLDAEPTRRRVLETKIARIADVGQAFKGVNTECVITVLENSEPGENRAAVEAFDSTGRVTWAGEIVQESFHSLPESILNIYLTDRDLQVINRMRERSVPLGELVSIKRGMELGKSRVRDSKGSIRTLLGEEVSRYSIDFGGTSVSSEQSEVERLRSHSDVPQKILIRRVCSDLTATIDEEGLFYTKNLYGAVSLSDLPLLYVLGIINSKPMNFFFKKYFTTKKKDIFPEFQKYQLARLPIRSIEVSNRDSRELADRIVLLAGRIITDKSRLLGAHTDRDKDYYRAKCTSVENQLNRLVCDLYELSDEERAIVDED
jgi:adenine-specific DNA-methyltransferase